MVVQSSSSLFEPEQITRGAVLRQENIAAARAGQRAAAKLRCSREFTGQIAVPDRVSGHIQRAQLSGCSLDLPDPKRRASRAVIRQKRVEQIRAGQADSPKDCRLTEDAGHIAVTRTMRRDARPGVVEEPARLPDP